MASSTKERLIAAANQRFYRDGFRNVGIDQILSDVGISKTAFYKHFESKEDLALEVLRVQDLWLREELKKMIQAHSGDDPVDQLRSLFDVVERIVEWEEFRGCFFINAAMEFPLMHDPVHVAAANNKQAIEEIVRDIAARTNAHDPAALAEELCMAMDGAYVTQQVTGSDRVAGIVRRIADMIIAAHLSNPS